MNAFEVITKYLPAAVDKYFAAESKTAILENGSKYIDVNFNETGYVKIASILMDGLSDYHKVQEQSSADSNYASYAGNLGSGYRDGFSIGGVDLSWEIFKLQWCRGKQFRIDYISNEETASVVIGNALEEFHRLKVIPEVDECRFSVLADQCSLSLGNLLAEVPGTDITDTNAATGIIHRFNAAYEWLTEHEVPEEEQVIFVSPVIMTYIRNTAELYRKLTQEEYRSEAGVTFSIEKYEGRPIIVVPSSRFFTDVSLTNNGFLPSSSSKGINYLVCSKKAIVPIRKVEYSKVWSPEAVQDFHGYKLEYQLYHGVVVPKNKVPGIYVSVGSSATPGVKSSTLSIDTRAGSATNYFKLNNYFTSPSGLRGTVVYSASAITLGSSVTIDETNVKSIAVGAEKDASTATSFFFALVDASGKAIAVSGSVQIVKHS